MFIWRDLPWNKESFFRSGYRLNQKSRWVPWVFIHIVEKKKKPRDTRGSKVKTVSLNSKGKKRTKE